MKTPAFWKNRSLFSTCLVPVSWVYYRVHQSRMRSYTPQSYPVPVLCIGNVTAGGAGKTPTVIALSQLIAKTFFLTAHVISRGYGGQLMTATQVDIQKHTAAEVGDEPLLIARHTPCWIAKRRTDAAQAAINAGANLILMDDGLQNPTIQKKASLLVIDGGFGIGNGRMLPAGPLREHWEDALKKASAVCIIGYDSTQIAKQIPAHIPAFYAALKADESTKTQWEDKRVLAFAGIARPQKFYDTLKELGASLVETKDFGDHHPYSQEEMIALVNLARKLDAQLVTTEKDFVRIPVAFQPYVDTLVVSLTWQDEPAVIAWLKQILK